MSSISFPAEQQPNPGHEGNYYSSSFDASSSFQMNPLSSHPPRTPRTSIISSNSTYVYGSSIYETKGETEDAIRADQDDELDEEQEEKAKVAETRIRKEEIWREMFLTSNGRDKAFVRRPQFHTYVAFSKPAFILETDAILYTAVPPFSYLLDC